MAYASQACAGFRAFILVICIDMRRPDDNRSNSITFMNENQFTRQK